MGKLGIITLNGYFNYGNRLQNYALQEVVNKLGFKCETIINKTYIVKTELEPKKSTINALITAPITEKINILNRKFNKKNILEREKNRKDIFKNFSKQYIKESNFDIKKSDISKMKIEEYSYFITGSDQVWNPNDPVVSEINFLTFAHENKRISYAPSFGVSEIQNKDKENYKTWLSGIEKISVREEAGAKIIKELTGRDVPVVLDPTMLLTKNEWLTIAKKDDQKPSKKYILTYFLGDIPNEYKKLIKKLSKKNSLEIVNLANLKVPKYYTNGPSEFIDYINSAEVFFTDSFHGCVFSLLMETPFVVCDRKGHSKAEKMSSRIDTFTEKFKLENRKFENINEKDILKCDYTISNQILKEERKKSLNFLKSALNCERDLKEYSDVKIKA